MAGLSSNWLLIVIGIVVLYAGISQSARRIVCYYSNWPQYRPGVGRYTVSNIDPFACTHLVFAFARIQDSKIKQYEFNDMAPNGGSYTAMTNLKQTNPNLVTFLAVGGWNHGPKNFTLMASSAQTRQMFIQDSISVLRRFNFDGLDLDWEYPGSLNTNDKSYFSSLLQEMRAAFEAEAVRTNRKRLLISAATAAGIKNAAKAYDIPVLERTVDMYNIMTYDYHGAWEKFTGLAAPMNSADNTMSVSSSISWYIQQGASPAKINLGITFYGRAWTLATPGDNRLGATAPGAGKKGTYTGEPGALSHYEVCAMQLQQNLASTLDPLGKTRYGVLGDQFITFDDVESIKIKTDYIVAMGLGGTMVWSLDHDDFTGQFCNQGKYPLLKAVKQAMVAAPSLPTNGGVQPPVVTQPPVVFPPVVTQAPFTYPPIVTQAPFVYPPIVTQAPVVYPPIVTQAPYTYPPIVTQAPFTYPPAVTQARSGMYSGVCPAQGGRIADPSSCYSYYVCLRGLKLRALCRGGYIFNPSRSVCEVTSTSSYRCPLQG